MRGAAGGRGHVACSPVACTAVRFPAMILGIIRVLPIPVPVPYPRPRVTSDRVRVVSSRRRVRAARAVVRRAGRAGRRARPEATPRGRNRGRVRLANIVVFSKR
jgi:hypothetical protein